MPRISAENVRFLATTAISSVSAPNLRRRFAGWLVDRTEVRERLRELEGKLRQATRRERTRNLVAEDAGSRSRPSFDHSKVRLRPVRAFRPIWESQHDDGVDRDQRVLG
jgi:hypothetical protein